MKATRAFYDRGEFPDGAIVEMTIWRIPEPVPGCAHAFKYSLFYGFPGKRLVSYDNERGKGDHRHTGSDELIYNFTTLDTLLADFERDVMNWRQP